MRTTKELLTIVKDNLYLMKDKKLAIGLCSVISTLSDKDIISSDEHVYLVKYLENNKPTNAIKRSTMSFDDTTYCQQLFWWKPCVIAPRLKWLNKQINSL